MDAGERVRVEIDGVAYEIVMVADSIARSGEVRRRGGLRVERCT
jgi:acid stress-induced BolA-like protein IbaG/YrbA